MKKLTIGSLCTGYGGLDLAAEQHFNAEMIWYSEIEKSCCSIIEEHWPGVPNIGNIKEIEWETIPRCDILVAGYPCQPFSVAGNRKGEGDERAIFEYIAEGISVLRPRTIVLENVKGHTTLGGTSVIGALTAMGYDSKWGVIRASDVGATHQRARLFIISTDEKTVTDTSCERHGSEQDFGMVGRVGTQTEIFGREASTTRQIAEHREQKDETVTDSDSPGPSEQSRTVAIKEEHTTAERSSCETDFGIYQEAIDRWTEVIGRQPPGPVKDDALNPSFVEWMMGLPENWVVNQGLTRRKEIKMLGNGVVPQQALAALKILTE